jgi:hypothetical protein
MCERRLDFGPHSVAVGGERDRQKVGHCRRIFSADNRLRKSPALRPHPCPTPDFRFARANGLRRLGWHFSDSPPEMVACCRKLCVCEIFLSPRATCTTERTQSPRFSSATRVAPNAYLSCLSTAFGPHDRLPDNFGGRPCCWTRFRLRRLSANRNSRGGFSNFLASFQCWRHTRAGASSPRRSVSPETQLSAQGTARSSRKTGRCRFNPSQTQLVSHHAAAGPPPGRRTAGGSPPTHKQRPTSAGLWILHWNISNSSPSALIRRSPEPQPKSRPRVEIGYRSACRPIPSPVIRVNN